MYVKPEGLAVREINIHCPEKPGNVIRARYRGIPNFGVLITKPLIGILHWHPSGGARSIMLALSEPDVSVL